MQIRTYVGRGRRAFLLTPLVLAWHSVALCATPAVDEIIRRSVTANDVDWKADPSFSHKERDRDANGAKTYEVTMVHGSPYRRLVMRNGKALSEDERSKEERKFQEMLSARASESPRQREDRIAKYRADRSREHVLMQQLTFAFDFKLAGESRVGKYDVYVLHASPRKGYQPPNMESQALLGMQGQLWIDKKTFQWVKVTARVIRPVAIQGILAEVEPGTYFELEKMPVASGIWLPKHYVMKSKSKILFLIGHETQADETYFDYRMIKPNSGG